MKINKHKIIIIVQAIVILLLLTWYALFLIHPVDLTTADLGRHIKNGEMVVNNNFEVLKTNFYSYTHTEHEFVNHHWLSGVIFYFIWNLFGFSGLSIFYILLTLATFLFFFAAARCKANFSTVAIVSFLLIPIMADRTEIRPEIFTYLLSGVFLWLLVRYQNQKLNKKWLWLLLPLMVVWVNLHIGFVFGLLIIGVFLFNALIKYFKNKNNNVETHSYASLPKNNFKHLLIILILSALVTLINPAGIQGSLQPLTIFNEYGYDIVENKSIPFLENYGIVNPNYLLVKILIIILALSFILIALFKRKNFSWPYFILAIIFSGLAFYVVRNITHFGLLALPVLALNIEVIKNKFNKWYTKHLLIILAVIIIGLSFVYHYDYLNLRLKNSDLGLHTNNNKSAEFFKQHKIQGPIFNNYDIGSYLILHLFPAEKVFTDNRPETYPVNFFQDIYIPMQNNEEIWQKYSEEYNLNAIFFSHRDYTSWGQDFLISRAMDDEWIPVYYDAFAIIFLKDVEQNKNIIQQYAIPKDYFNIKKTN